MNEPWAVALEALDVAVLIRAQTENGAILACPTYPTYRFAWLRDGSFCAVALDAAGRIDAADRFHAWAAGRVLDHEPAMRRAIEAVSAGRRPGPHDHLPCRFTGAGVAPTGDGWGAFQMDGAGLWLWALRVHARQAGPFSRMAREIARAAAVATEYLAALWRQPSFDAWEEHGDRLSTSTLAACLEGLLAGHRMGYGSGGAADAVDAIRAEIAIRGRRLGYLPRSDADASVDASLLWCAPLLGALHPDSPSWGPTVAKIESDLVDDEGGVHRYCADGFYGGGAWPVLTAALGLAYLQRGSPGDLDRAARCAAWVERQRAPSGDLPEQSSRHLLHPDQLAIWQQRWGAVASPLSWSHAMAILLRRGLEARQLGSSTASWAA
jgi:GH15 family glucan-1,4-alpha-glucosidase